MNVIRDSLHVWLSVHFSCYLIFSVVIKIIPCIMLTVVSLRLINSLMEAKKRKDMLLKKRNTSPAVVGGNHAVSPGGARSGNNARAGGGNGDHESGGSDRTTRMLLAVLLLFLITEFPQGLLGLLSGVLGDAFFKSCYIPLADLMDFVALLNSAINFILYCAMSKKFRDTFTKVFHLNRLIKLVRRRSGRVHSVPVSANNHNHTPANQHLLPPAPQPIHENTVI